MSQVLSKRIHLCHTVYDESRLNDGFPENQIEMIVAGFEGARNYARLRLSQYETSYRENFIDAYRWMSLQEARLGNSN